ncbi:MAG: tetratricopeptide repeat protein, partial [Myxococcales bacterium]|nr:tetratricopeptide repeat protein [Myxococcales bacterium]
GEIEAAPADSRVPQRIRRAVLRGLDVDPAERWPSMAALLAELERDPTRARRRVGLVVGAAAVVGLAALGATQWRENATTAALEECRASERAIEEFVDEGRRAAIRARLLGTEVSYAERSVNHAFAALDEFAAGWTEVHARSCEGAVRERTIAPAMMALRERCAARQLDEAEAIVEVLEGADATVVEHIGGLLTSLPDPARCDDLKVLAELEDELDDAGSAAREEALRARLFRAQAELDAGRFKEAKARVDALLDESEAGVDRGLRSEILVTAGHTASQLGELDRAEELYLRALDDAFASDRVGVAASAVNGLAGDATYRRGEIREGMRWSRIAAGLVERADEPALRFQHALLRAGIASQRRAYAESLERYQEAVALASALRLSPVSRASLRTNLGNTLTYVGRFAEASAEHGAAEAILVEAYGVDHPELGSIVANAGVTHMFAGEVEAATRDYERAVSLQARYLGERHPFFAMTLQNLASAKLEAGDIDGAYASATRARAILAETVADDEFFVGYVASGLGDIQRRRGDAAAAKENCAAGLTILSRFLGEDHVHLIYPLLCLSELALAEGDAAAARTMLARADGLLGDSVDVSEADRGHVALALARALAATAERERARAAAAKAEAAFKAAGPAYEALRAEARALAETSAAGAGGA